MKAFQITLLQDMGLALYDMAHIVDELGHNVVVKSPSRQDIDSEQMVYHGKKLYI